MRIAFYFVFALLIIILFFLKKTMKSTKSLSKWFILLFLFFRSSDICNQCNINDN